MLFYNYGIFTSGMWLQLCYVSWFKLGSVAPHATTTTHLALPDQSRSAPVS